MKILQINAVNKYGSTGRTCFEMSEYLWQHGHESYLAFSNGSEDCYSKRVSSRIECKVHALISRITGLQGYYSYFSTQNIISYCKKICPDVVIVRNIHANFVNQKKLFEFLAKNDIPTLLALDDCWLFTGGCTHYTLQKCRNWEDGCGNCPNKKHEGTNWFFDRTNKIITDRKKWYDSIPRLGVIGVSNWIVNESKKSFAMSNVKMFNSVYNWVDTEKFNIKDATDLRLRLKAENKKIILGVASSWSEKKGFSDFIKLADSLDDNYLIVLVGKVNTSVQHKNLLFVGATESIDELADYYNVADVFVTFSLEESFGKVSAEALSCGTPVVCYDSTANGEIVGEGCGAVIDFGNFNAIKDAIVSIANCQKREYQSRCRKYAVDSFEKSVCIEKYVYACEQLIEVRREEAIKGDR